MVTDQVIIGRMLIGERIAYSILSHIPGGKEKIWKRLWASSLTKKLFKSFSGIKEPSRPIITIWAEARAQSDWLVGMNLSSATIDLQAKDSYPNKEVFISWPVQTPAIRLVCENDLAIRNFTPENIGRLQLEDKKNGVFFSHKR